jgi:hypothetical protein
MWRHIPLNNSKFALLFHGEIIITPEKYNQRNNKTIVEHERVADRMLFRSNVSENTV